MRQGPVNPSERAIMMIACGVGGFLARYPDFPLSVANFRMADDPGLGRHCLARGEGLCADWWWEGLYQHLIRKHASADGSMR